MKPSRPSPLISVIVLNLNGEYVIARCLDHLLRQTYPNYEIIVVDNNSSDNSLALIERYFGVGRISVIQSPYNRGCPGGRNLGVQYADGEFVAFVDNDGYAHPDWLAEALTPFLRDPSVGAVSSVVFFNKNKFVLNGAGGGINLQGYGGDHCFYEPYEFAQLPSEVLYPMGCGMMVRRDVLDEIGPWDEAVLNYYDDTELGFRVWKSGYRVVVAPYAWVDHEFNYSTRFVPSKGILIEKGRIRTALKYYPQRRLGQWLRREAGHIWKQGLNAYVFIWAWLWNLVHLRSALRWRGRFSSERKTFDRLLSPTWGWFPVSAPTHALYRPNLLALGRDILLDERAEAQLNFGWYPVERDGTTPFRWMAAQASAFFRLSRPASFLSLTVRVPTEEYLHVIVRRIGDVEPVWEGSLADMTPATQWQIREVACPLQEGDYELLLLSEKPSVERRHPMGIAVARIEFK